MNIIKFILGLLGVVFGVLIILWVLGFLWSIIWYLIVFGVIGAIGYGAYSLFKKAEAKALGYEKPNNLSGADINMSWDEYDKKYLHK